MSYMKDEREALVQVITDALAIRAFPYVPDIATAPYAAVVPGNPYIEEGQTFREHKVNFEIWLIGVNGSNDRVTEELDANIQTLIVALLESKFSVEAINEPFIYQHKGGEYLSVGIAVSTSISFI